MMKHRLENYGTGSKPAAVALFTVLGCLCACSSPVDEFHITDGEVTVINNTFTVRAFQQNWTNPDETASYVTFEPGDRISVFAYVADAADSGEEEMIADNIINTYDGKNWYPEYEMKWKSATGGHHFLAIFPAVEGKDIDLSALEYDISDGPLMTASASTGYTMEPIVLELAHLSGRLDVRVMIGSEYVQGEVSVKGVRLTGKSNAVVDCYTREMVPGLIDHEIELEQVGDEINGVKQFSAVLLPQDYLPGSLSIVTDRDGEEEIMTPEDMPLIEIREGKICSMDLILGEHSLTVAQIGTDDWETGDSSDGQIVQIY